MGLQAEKRTKEYVAAVHARQAVLREIWRLWRLSTAEALHTADHQWGLAESFFCQCRQGDVAEC